tara:strand:- start:1335 stop:2132 length:798 start_codon:yes stop_codon:yes gene_type:complete
MINKTEEYVIKYDQNNRKQIIKHAKSLIDKYNFCIIKGFNNLDTQKEIFKIFDKRLSESKDIRISGGFYYNMPDYCRLDIGDSYQNSRFSRYMLFCEWNKNNKELFALISNLLEFRNDLSGIKKKNHIYDFEDEKIDNQYFYCDVIRMIQYPIGGGFLSSHNDQDDTFYPDKMINMLLPITTRRKLNSNLDIDLQKFQRGGFYYIHNGKKIDVEDIIDSGDLVIHNTTIDHGVNCIDNDKDLDLVNLCGRITLNFSIGLFSKQRP